MFPAAAAQLLAAALGMNATLELGLRAEARGLDGGPPGQRAFAPVPYELTPSVRLAAQVDPRLSVATSLVARCLMLAGPAGGAAVHSVAGYLDGTAATAWRASERLTLGLSLGAAGGRQSTSALIQAYAPGDVAPTAPQPGQPGASAPPPLDPYAGVRTGRTTTLSAQAGLDWRATRSVTIGGTAGGSRSGGSSEADRQIFPLRQVWSAEAYASLAAARLDTVALRAGGSRTEVGSTDRIDLATLSTRWERRGDDDALSVSAGAVATMVDTTSTVASGPLGRVAPSAGATFSRAAPTGGRGVGLRVAATYAPFVDPYVARVRQRLSGLAGIGWNPRQDVQLDMGVSAATAMDPSRTGPSVVAADLGATIRRDRWEIGLSLRGAYQEAEAPLPTTWQWGLRCDLRWPGRTAG